MPTTSSKRNLWLVLAAFACSQPACGDGPTRRQPDHDAAEVHEPERDAAQSLDAAATDDAGPDAAIVDAGLGADAAIVDAAILDAAAPDAAELDASTSVPLSVALSTPVGPVYASQGLLHVVVTVAGAPEQVTLWLDGVELTTLGAPYEHDLALSALSEATHELVAHVQRGNETLLSAPLSIVIDRTPPLLLATSPEDGDDNVAADFTIELSLSEPVSLAPDSITLSELDTGSTLPIDVVLSQDAQHVRITLQARPAAPSQLQLSLTSDVVDRAGNALDPVSLSFSVPVFLRLGAELDTQALGSVSELRLAVDASGAVIALFLEDGVLRAARFAAGAWSALGGVVSTPSPVARGPSAALGFDALGAPLAAFRQAGAAVISRFDGNAWQELATSPDLDASGSYAPGLGHDASGAPVLVFDDATSGPTPELHAYRFVGGAYEWLDSIAREDLDGLWCATAADGSLVIAYGSTLTDPGLHTLRFDGATFAQPITAKLASKSSGSTALAAGAAGDAALSAQGHGTTRIAAASFSALASDLGLVSSANARDRALAIAPDGKLWTAFVETPTATPLSRVYVQRDEGSYFQPIGPALVRDAASHGGMPALAFDAAGQLVVGWLETPEAGGPTRAYVSRYNGPLGEAPRARVTRKFDAACLATLPQDGSLLTQTGCFSDALGRQPVAGFIPFDVKSPLWTDGAFKRRFLMLPDGAQITYRDPGLWTLPAGSILLKEFALEGHRGDPRTIRPVETRLLVVTASGNWQRYSYEWNQAATQATLRAASPAKDRTDFQLEDETGAPITQTHFFPSRSLCLQCHEAPGIGLGLQTVMQNRNFDYGSAVDNQLRVWSSLLAFDPSAPAQLPVGASSMPNPEDTTYPLQPRLRAYLHSNCSSCHHPLFGMDLRYETPTFDGTSSDSGLCTKITKSDLNGSVIYWRDILRQAPNNPGIPAPMPPLGTLITNPVNEQLLTDWIMDPQNPCP